MSLLAPLGLAALIAIPLIIVFHMRHFTPVERPVPTLRFWQAAEPSRTEDARFRMPPLSLLLLLQLLVAGLLAAALARPAVSDAWAGIAQRTELEHLVVILDGSTSMAAGLEGDDTSRFELARDRAVERLEALREGDTATVMVLGTQVTTLQANEKAEINDLAERLQTLELPGGIADLDAALRLVADLDLPGVREQILVLSDGAISANPAIVESLNAPVDFERFGAEITANLAITDAKSRPSSENPARSDLYLQITNFSDERQATTVAVAADGFEVYREDLILDPNTATDVVVDTLPESASQVVAEVRSTDLFFADNQANVSLQQNAEFALQILLVSDTVSYLQRALAALPGATVVSISSAESLRGEVPPGPYDLVVYEGTTPVQGDIPDAPLVLVNSPRDGLLATSGMITIPTVERIRANDPILRRVDLAGLTFFETPVHDLDSTAVEIVGAEGGPLIYRASVPGSDQPMIVITFDLQQSNLPHRIAFPILIANIVGELSPNPLPATVPLGDPVTYSPHAAAEVVQVTDPRGTAFDLPVAQSPDTGNPESESSVSLNRDVTFTATGHPGEYRLTELNTSGQPVASATFMVNAGHPRESDLRADPELSAVLASATGSGDGGVQRSLSDLWPALAAMALGLLLFEWFWMMRPRRKRTVSVATGGAR